MSKRTYDEFMETNVAQTYTIDDFIDSALTLYYNKICKGVSDETIKKYEHLIEFYNKLNNFRNYDSYVNYLHLLLNIFCLGCGELLTVKNQPKKFTEDNLENIKKECSYKCEKCKRNYSEETNLSTIDIVKVHPSTITLRNRIVKSKSYLCLHFHKSKYMKKIKLNPSQLYNLLNKINEENSKYIGIDRLNILPKDMIPIKLQYFKKYIIIEDMYDLYLQQINEELQSNMIFLQNLDGELS